MDRGSDRGRCGWRVSPWAASLVVGGTSILGGVGAVWRTVVGVLSMALIGDGSILLGLDPLYEQITMGVILLAAVGLDARTARTA